MDYDQLVILTRSYTSPDGSEQTVNYIADDNGYRVIGGTSFGKGGSAVRPQPPKAVPPPPPAKVAPPPSAVKPAKVNVATEPTKAAVPPKAVEVDAGHHILVPVPVAAVPQFVPAEALRSPGVQLIHLPYPLSYSLGLPFFPGGHAAPLPFSYILRLVRAGRKK